MADYIAQYLANYGVQHVFMISGGGAMHLNDAFGRCENIQYICNYNEQASAIAAEGYARTAGKLAVVNVTTGPGGTNAVSGVFGQWTDSAPVLYISGQVKRETMISSYPELHLRQLGDQEVDIISIVKPITKFAVSVRDPNKIRLLLEQAIYCATTGRPGPVWIDVPLDIQAALVDEEHLTGFKPIDTKIQLQTIDKQVDDIVAMLKVSARPVLLAGNGIHISNKRNDFLQLVEQLGVPVVTTFNGFDLIPSTHSQFIGRVGTIGTRAGNFAVQNADLLLCLGTRNNLRQISYNYAAYARAAKKIIVDIDKAELYKPTVTPDLAIQADLASLLPALLKSTDSVAAKSVWGEWLTWCLDRKRKYPVVLEEYKSGEKVNPYYFAQVLTELLPEYQVAVTGNATVSIVYFQGGNVKEGQRVLWNSGCAAMGYDLPAAIGACFANGKKDVICLAGDGSLQMNIQELQTVAYYNLPIKIFVFNNEGYISIKQTQDNFFGGKRVASDSNSGVGNPDFVKLAEAYGLPSMKISDQKNLQKDLQMVLETKGPILCEVMLPNTYQFQPKLSSKKLPDGSMVSRPLEDMYPFLDEKELWDNLLIPEWRS